MAGRWRTIGVRIGAFQAAVIAAVTLVSLTWYEYSLKFGPATVWNLFWTLVAIFILLALFFFASATWVTTMRQDNRRVVPSIAVYFVGAAMFLVLHELVRLGKNVEYLTTMAAILASVLVALAFDRQNPTDAMQASPNDEGGETARPPP